jgi:hypothetical protein
MEITQRRGSHRRRDTLGQRPRPGRRCAKAITELARLSDALADMVDAKAIGAWLKHPNLALDGSTPLQVIERGETDRIWRMIWEIQAGNVG